jgi:hypothetical protein
MTEDSPQHDTIERATRARLARLARIPVDLAQARAELSRLIERESEPAGRMGRRWRGWPTWTSLAASIVIAAIVFLVLSGTGSAVYAAPAEMVRLHRDMVNGQAPAIPVGNIDEARRVIGRDWPDAPSLPSVQESADNVHACCLKGVQSRRVACVLLRRNDVPVTVVVAKARDFRSADGSETTIDGRKYIVQSRDGIRMVMTRRGDRWMCFMGELPEDELVRLASQLSDESKP